VTHHTAVPCPKQPDCKKDCPLPTPRNGREVGVRLNGRNRGHHRLTWGRRRRRSETNGKRRSGATPRASASMILTSYCALRSSLPARKHVAAAATSPIHTRSWSKSSQWSCHTAAQPMSGNYQVTSMHLPRLTRCARRSKQLRGVSQVRVSSIKHADEPQLRTMRRFIEALGGELIV